MFLLDTDTIIFSLKGNAAVQTNLQLHLHDPMEITTITLMELYYGAYKSQKVTSNLAKIKTIEQAFNVLPIGMESVEIFGMLKAQLETKGTRLDDFDLIIASCALANNLILVTNNIRHFQRIDGLKLTTWLEQP